jgi:hypothetical protein
MRTLKITNAEVLRDTHGPDRVAIMCDDAIGLEVEVPRGSGEAYRASLGDSLTFARAQITAPEEGKRATLQLDTRRGDGTHVGPAAVDFDLWFRDEEEARAMAKALFGFTEATVVKMRPAPRRKGARNRGAPRTTREGDPLMLMLPEVEAL